MNTEELVIGIGSPFGDDQAGWEVIKHLELISCPASLVTLRLDRPGPELINNLQGYERVILVDALFDQQMAAGEARELTFEQLEQTQSSSTHGIGLAQTLALARALGQLPAKLKILAISGTRFQPNDRLSPEVKAAAHKLAQRLVAEHQMAIGKGGVGSLGSSSSSSPS